MIIQHDLTSLNARNKLKGNISGLKKSSDENRLPNAQAAFDILFKICYNMLGG